MCVCVCERERERERVHVCEEVVGTVLPRPCEIMLKIPPIILFPFSQHLNLLFL